MKWKRLFSRLLISIAAVYMLVFVFINHIRPLEYHRCDLYTNVMNGGIKTFQGKDYRIELCGLNGIIQPENFHDDEVRLRVFSMEGELLAERYYAPLLGMGFGIQVEYGNDYLTYDTATTDPKQKIAIPPSRWEQMRAQLPRMRP